MNDLGTYLGSFTYHLCDVLVFLFPSEKRNLKHLILNLLSQSHSIHTELFNYFFPLFFLLAILSDDPNISSILMFKKHSPLYLITGNTPSTTFSSDTAFENLCVSFPFLLNILFQVAYFKRINNYNVEEISTQLKSVLLLACSYPIREIFL